MDDKGSSFVGSDFLYEDVSGRSIDLDTHEIVESENKDLYKIKNTPKEESGVDFKYYYVWIDKANFMPMKAEYYDEQDNLYRTVEALTELEFKNIKYDIGLTDDIFTERYLRRPPFNWLE